MLNEPLVSLCMPTNGVVEWVFPVLDSIYSQGCDDSLFEVVITDNGDNAKFKKKIKEYRERHQNLVYVETKALPFLNEIESYKKGTGELIKFVNHRTKLVSGFLKNMINFVKENREEKPIIYFSNGALKISKDKHEYKTFDEFVKNLSYLSSWSTGMTIWKSDFEKLPENIEEYNVLFPHTNILFNETNRERYVIDNSIVFDEISQGKKAKGNYDLFFAFGVEYPSIICDLLRVGNISSDTFRYVADRNLGFVASLYWEYCIRKRYCSYDLNGLVDMFGVFYSKKQLNKRVVRHALKKLIKKVIRR